MDDAQLPVLVVYDKIFQRKPVREVLPKYGKYVIPGMDGGE